MQGRKLGPLIFLVTASLHITSSQGEESNPLCENVCVGNLAKFPSCCEAVTLFMFKSEKRLYEGDMRFGKRMFDDRFGKRMFDDRFGKRMFDDRFGKRMMDEDRFGKRSDMFDDRFGKRMFDDRFGKRMMDEDRFGKRMMDEDRFGKRRKRSISINDQDEEATNLDQKPSRY